MGKLKSLVEKIENSIGRHGNELFPLVAFALPTFMAIYCAFKVFDYPNKRTSLNVETGIEQNSGDKVVFYNTGKGEYLTAEQMEQREIEKIESSYQEQLRKTNEFYQRTYDPNSTQMDVMKGGNE